MEILEVKVKSLEDHRGWRGDESVGSENPRKVGELGDNNHPMCYHVVKWDFRHVTEIWPKTHFGKILPEVKSWMWGVS